jgi:hypothetical protein
MREAAFRLQLSDQLRRAGNEAYHQVRLRARAAFGGGVQQTLAVCERAAGQE